MKKIITLLFLAMVAMNTSAIAAAQTNNTAVSYVSGNAALTAADVTRLTNRLEEISKMNLKAMSASDKKQLREEVKGIQAKFNAPIGGGIYISAGALILILVLLIIFL